MISKIEYNSNDVRVFRDDIYPFLGGGNKGRKIKYIEKDIIKKKSNAVVTTGGIQSNHCRALAVLAAQNGWKCTLVLHGNPDRFKILNGNAKLMRNSGAEIIFVAANNISIAMDVAMNNYNEQGLKPYYVWGGGHTIEGGLAYIEAVKELKQYCIKESWEPKYIFLASGTGSTQAGIMAGLDNENIDAQVVGISVARDRKRAEQVVSEFYNDLIDFYKITTSNRDVTVLDDYLCGGYELFDTSLKKVSNNSLKNFGFILDTTYSGKGFYGMDDYIKRNNLCQEKILFWHTGGVLNYLN
ncbi:D-cysteine desulfhydrase [Patiriisocius marinistellae]|uniref:D-cysteine desulfhydrase n=1 Tax=Patiriisocius marinistellae TaxID=2494560 RepID=A0A5J4G0G7_9FLAO|nr:pyridoxal-phosphate dependent enzyme [Patiriisocius marinistellae]GEQ87198.1 D-cysteine desulfhydrase [Patiriisocius marinistellae]